MHSRSIRCLWQILSVWCLLKSNVESATFTKSAFIALHINFIAWGRPFVSDADYIEDVWVTQLYYCVKDNMRSQNLQLLPSFQYSRNFGKFQQLISDQE